MQTKINALVAGTESDDNLRGTVDSDVLNGLGGNDELIGDAGADILIGGTGNDVYWVDSGDTVTELAGEGEDWVFSENDFVLTAGAHVEVLATDDGDATTAINLTGNELGNTLYGNAGANTLHGADGNDRVVGGAGNDTVIGGAGQDQLEGGAGNDVYWVESGDTITELAGEGEDWVFSENDFVLTDGAHVEVLATDDGDATTAINLRGNELGNTLYGNAGANTLHGADGNDRVVGGAGNDTVIGGAGQDQLEGGAGNDVYWVESGDAVTELAGEGEDWVFSENDFVLTDGAHVEVLGTEDGDATMAINLTGNELGNSLYGNAGANALNGGGGDDYLTGGGGADRFVFSGTPGSDRIADFESGSDQIDLSAFGITMDQVSVTSSGSDTILSIDSDMNGIVDFTISLAGVGEPGSGDYIF